MPPSNSNNPLVKAAPVFITRPSSEVLIFRGLSSCPKSRPAAPFAVGDPWPPDLAERVGRQQAMRVEEASETSFLGAPIWTIEG